MVEELRGARKGREVEVANLRERREGLGEL